MESTFLGIDLGTSAIKFVLIDSRRNVVAQSSREYEPAVLNNGASEIDPEVWFSAAVDGMKEILASSGAGKLKGIGVTGQMHTLVTLDEHGKTVRPAIMWNDMRTKDLVPDLKERFLHYQEGDYLSRIISTGSPATSLFWMKLEEKEQYDRIRKFLIGPDYLVFRLTGVTGTDYCEASTSGMYCVRGRHWSEEIRELLGLNESVFPEVRGSGIVVGTLLKEVCRELQLDEEVRVIAGTGDNPAASFSTGCLEYGYPVLSLGTSGVFTYPAEDIDQVTAGKVIQVSVDGRRFTHLIQGVVQSTGSTLNWWTEKIIQEKDFRKLNEGICLKKEAERKLLFYPHLQGDKTIYADPDIRGAFLGLSADTTRQDMYYAILEGLSFAFRQLSEVMNLPLKETGCLKVVGGGSGSDVWMQILADTLNVQTQKLEGNTGAAFGIALLAMKSLSAGTEDSENDHSLSVVHIEKRFNPDSEISGILDKKYQMYLKINRAVKQICG